MKARIYKLNFARVHFGERHLEDAGISFTADRLFSALMFEAIKNGEEVMHKFKRIANASTFRISDAFPYRCDELYYPKPVIIVERDLQIGDSAFEEALESREVAKKVKKMHYIPESYFDDYVNCKLSSNDIHDIARVKTGEVSLDEKASISRTGEDADLYRVGAYSFEENYGLWVLVITEDQDEKFIEELFYSLGYTGIGGKRSAGYGMFKLEVEDLSDLLKEKLVSFNKDDLKTSGSENHNTGKKEQYMLLSTALPIDDELEEVLKDGTYLLKRSGGFVSSSTYMGTSIRKRDVYKFSAGSVFTRPFNGQIIDVSPENFEHEVLNYAKGVFIKL
ncbi:MAG: type III-A CRISPR-associated RAMP protein Csm4 [Candidatus Ancillula sp.]|jgi:CRISPR-associated protein Csm4|nr:type III-A CRISPR-associated RAMP protein Csm4 [Candidatus Ancillula sp.]